MFSYFNDLVQVGPSFDAIMDAIGQVVEKQDPKTISFTPVSKYLFDTSFQNM